VNILAHGKDFLRKGLVVATHISIDIRQNQDRVQRKQLKWFRSESLLFV